MAAAAMLAALSGYTQAQGKFDPKLLKNDRYTLACYKVKNGHETPIGTLTVGLHAAGDKFSVITLTAFTGMEVWKDTAVSDLKSFRPVYRSSHNSMREMVLHFEDDITGYHIDKKTGRENQIKESGNRSFVDSYTYPFLLSTLPLNSGYQTDFSVYDYKPANTDNVKTAVVQEVKNSTYVSQLTGNHDVWEVTVHEPSTGEKSISYIDKKTRHLWQVDIFSKGLQVRMIDTESGSGALKVPFDKEATLQMVNGGKATISGQVFARNHSQSKHITAKIQLVNWDPKQAAPRGTEIILIPYNDYFKEWVKVNETQQKKGLEGITLSEEASGCIKRTTVYDDAGHFEFVNLMPGDYLLYTEFNFVHTWRETEVVGYSDYYKNGTYQTTVSNTESKKYSEDLEANIKKIVTVSKPGEKVEVKLKKTK
ncbi:hypothetical protein HHL17_03595 [Chitinophaga sp. G-6-1-13]|uniref:Carboxypeptidase regulatory-like domain-containing protein n=1 Tax=Chitinophaga fulva TaxID=2728842 RepID=A0A848GCR9_9BACT|nr:hypothetical protein [Chitinophaga fulva]NML36274.1 hypothetical protein [Chitinophaga fulva]